jgi:uncharacterized protein
MAIKPPDEMGIYHGSTRLEVSRSLEAELPDNVAWELIDQMHDDFVAGRFDQAATTGVRSILNRLAQMRGLVLPPGQTHQPASQAPSANYHELIEQPWLGLATVLGMVLVAAIPFAAIPLLIFSARTRSRPWQPNGPAMQYNDLNSSTRQANGQDVQQADMGTSSDAPVAASSVDTSYGQFGPMASTDPGTFSSSGDFGSSSSGGGDFGGSGGGGDFGGGGATGNF